MLQQYRNSNLSTMNLPSLLTLSLQRPPGLAVTFGASSLTATSLSEPLLNPFLVWLPQQPAAGNYLIKKKVLNLLMSVASRDALFLCLKFFIYKVEITHFSLSVKHF